jgi:ATP-binding cassette subfamily F protein 3
MRIELAKILLLKPELLLLDEPTNHLDIESIEWLEEYLQSYPGALVLISHDRAFLDNITNRTIEIMLSKVYDYDASYSKYVVLRQERREQQLATYRNQQKMIEKTEDFIERFRYKATKSNQVQSRIKQLNKIERVEVDEEDLSSLNMRFPKAPRSGNVVFMAKDLSKKYGQFTVFKHAQMEVERGQKVALVGRNGEGKSTLLKILMGQLEASAGEAQLGHQVNIGYFAQNQDDLLNPEETVFNTMDRVAVGDVRTRLRDILGAFLFRGEDVDKKVKVLSGGERSRLAMARLMLEPYNLLVLDEPTNHLDMRSKDILKQALLTYDGTVIVVSHDREFLDGLVSKIYEFRDGRVKEHLGGIYDFLRRRKLEHLNEIERKTVVAVPKEAAKATIKEKEPEKKTAEPVKPTTQQNFQQKKEYDKQLRKLRATVEKLESEIEQIDAQLAGMNDTLSHRPDAADEVFFQEYNTLKKRQEDAFWQWEKSHQAVEIYIKNNS